MIHLSRIQRKPPAGESTAYPLAVPSIASLSERAIESEVTFFVGENGSGKSTLLEALAIAAQRPAIGGENPDGDRSLDAVRPLADSSVSPST